MRALPVSMLICLPLIAACAPLAEDTGGKSCKSVDGSYQMQADLFFGRDIAGRAPVTPAEQASFLADVVTPRFPDGLTMWETYGQWRDPSTGQVGKEDSFVVRIVAPETRVTLERLSEIRSAYKQQFHQQSVGLVFSRSCASF